MIFQECSFFDTPCRTTWIKFALLGIEHFETCLFGKARTDHQTLHWLSYFENPRSQVARWLGRLSDFDMAVEHRPGRLHGNADGLSRISYVKDGDSEGRYPETEEG